MRIIDQTTFNDAARRFALCADSGEIILRGNAAHLAAALGVPVSDIRPGSFRPAAATPVAPPAAAAARAACGSSH